MSNVRCNDIKPNERKLFRYLIRQIDYSNLNSICIVLGYIEKSRFIKEVRYFSESRIISYNQIEYYLNKWNTRGILKIYNNCVYFDFAAINSSPIYRSMIPSRVNRKFLNVYKNFQM